ncbi:MAG TPA: nitrile hydratase subunit alpha [Burkholderiales bacterium]|nr:nitrile hydratase subunit alpha [Burkholderiales bacterium]
MSEHSHGHRHDHARTFQPDHDSGGPLPYLQVMEIATRELLIEKGIITPQDVQRQIERMDARGHSRGARVVARAWSDPQFKSRLLANGRAGCDEMGITDLEALHLVIVENTDKVHNVIVCTLCSCYPKPLLGLPPAWYKSLPYRRRMVREPRAVLTEFGVELPNEVVVRVHDSTADMRYMVLPRRPEGTEGWSEERLAGIVSRDCLIGVALPHA